MVRSIIKSMWTQASQHPQQTNLLRPSLSLKIWRMSKERGHAQGPIATFVEWRREFADRKRSPGNSKRQWAIARDAGILPTSQPNWLATPGGSRLGQRINAWCLARRQCLSRIGHAVEQLYNIIDLKRLHKLDFLWRLWLWPNMWRKAPAWNVNFSLS